MTKVDNFLNFTIKMEEFGKSPEKYLSLRESEAEEIKRFTGDLYNFTKRSEQKNKTSETLYELVVQNVDEEQIWQQIELQNNSICDKIVREIAYLLAKKDLSFSLRSEKSAKRTRFNDSVRKSKNDDKDVQEGYEIRNEDNKNEIDIENEDETEENENDVDEDENDIEDDNGIEDEDESDDMEDEDENDDMEDEDENDDVEDKEDESHDMEDEEENQMFEKDEDNNLMKNESVDENDVPKQPSTYEARQERLKLKIKALEDEALKEKPWQLKGEVTARSRPQNSLLEEYVEFDIASRPAPVLTEKSTLKLEDIILQRIKDKAWDDVIRKVKPIEADLEYKKRLVLDQEKSKLSLAQIYEQEYLNQLDKKNESVIDKPEVEAPEHKEIRTMMNKLFAKLDALSNFHFTPKQVKEDVTVVSNIPAIHMEEVAPVATSDAALLAPEEVKPKSKGELIGKSERTATDKKRERRQKKIRQKLKFKKIEAKEKEKLEKDSKEGRNKKISQKLLQKITKSRNVSQIDQNQDRKYLKSSEAFFSRLQDRTTSSVQKGLDSKKPSFGKKLKSKKSKNR